MTDLLLHPQTRTHIDDVITSQASSVLLLGSPGTGKRYLAEYVAAQLLQVPIDEVSHQPAILIVEPIKNSIGIDQAREITRYLQLKTIGRQNVRRVILIENAHLMTFEAQNALLKTLEEPPQDTVLILTAVPAATLKRTIVSRTQQVQVLPVTKDDAMQHISQHRFIKDSELDKVYSLSRGNAGLLLALVGNEQPELTVSIAKAKEFLTASLEDRFVLLDVVCKDKQQTAQLIEALRRLVLSTLESAISKDSPGKLKWLGCLQDILRAEKLLQYNPNPKLLLTNLALEL